MSALIFPLSDPRDFFSEYDGKSFLSYLDYHGVKVVSTDPYTGKKYKVALLRDIWERIFRTALGRTDIKLRHLMILMSRESNEEKKQAMQNNIEQVIIESALKFTEYPPELIIELATLGVAFLLDDIENTGTDSLVERVHARVTQLLGINQDTLSQGRA